MLALNVDTSRLSLLASNPEHPGHSRILRILEAGDVAAVVCISRVVELSKMPDRKRRNVVALLRSIPTLIGQPESVLQEDELACGCAKAMRLSRRPPKAFARDTGDWGYFKNAPGGTAADLLEVADPTSAEAVGFRLMADEHIGHADIVRDSAAVVSDRTVALRLALERHLKDFRLRTEAYASGFSAEEIIAAAGGLAAFPSFEVGAELVAARLIRASVGEANDLLDEDIARYHPYSAASLLDHATKNRFWAAGIRGRERVTSTFEECAQVIERVHSGGLQPVQSYLAD